MVPERAMSRQRYASRRNTRPSGRAALRSLWDTAGASASAEETHQLWFPGACGSAPALKAHGRNGGSKAAALFLSRSSEQQLQRLRKLGRFSKSATEILRSPSTASSLRTVVPLPENACNSLRHSDGSELFQSTYPSTYQKL